MNYVLHILVMLEIYILLALSAHQKVGLSGLLSLAQAVFYGLGAYSIALSMSYFGIGYWSSLMIVIAVSILAGLLFSAIANRVRDLYFSIATLAIQIMFFAVIYNWIPVTNGPYGIAGISSPSVFGYQLSSPLDFALFGGAFVLLVLFMYHKLWSTALFRMIRATRDDQLGLTSLGKDPAYYKRISIILSAVLAGVAGSIYASYTSYIDPSSFTLDESILILSIVLIGGVGRIIGPVTGAFIYVLLPEVLKFVHLPDSMAANMRMILFGLLLILIVRFRPQGLLGKRLVR